MLPSGTLGKFVGKTHDNGGIKTNLPGGSFIFSEYTKAPKELVEDLGLKYKEQSYADLSKKFPTTKYTKVLDTSTDEIDKNTAEVNLTRNLGILSFIGKVQEAEKSSKSIFKKDEGGFTDPKVDFSNINYDPNDPTLNFTSSEYYEEDTNSYTPKPLKDYVKPAIDKAKNLFGNISIDPALAGTIADIALVGATNLRVKPPVLANRQRQPLFSKFKEFDPQELDKGYSLAINNINASALPEQVKQARIADLTANYLDNKSKIELSENQRYQDFQDRQLDKLQAYNDFNIQQRRADLEEYMREEGHNLTEQNKFKTWKHQQIVNSVRGYVDYVQSQNTLNKTDRNYTINPITGKITFKEKPTSELDLLNQMNNIKNTTNIEGVKVVNIPGIGLRQVVLKDDGTTKLEEI